MPRPIAGRLTYAEHPEPGTIIGQRGLTREWLVALEPDGQPGTPIGYATPDELAAAVLAPSPRSVVEVRARA